MGKFNKLEFPMISLSNIKASLLLLTILLSLNLVSASRRIIKFRRLEEYTPRHLQDYTPLSDLFTTRYITEMNPRQVRAEIRNDKFVQVYYTTPKWENCDYFLERFRRRCNKFRNKRKSRLFCKCPNNAEKWQKYIQVLNFEGDGWTKWHFIIVNCDNHRRFCRKQGFKNKTGIAIYKNHNLKKKFPSIRKMFHYMRYRQIVIDRWYYDADE